MTRTVPPCANAHGNAKPPAPKMALMTLMMAAVSPVSPVDAAAGVAEDAAEVVRRSPRFMDAGWSVVVIACLWADGAIEAIRWSLPPTTGCLTGVAVRLARRGAEAVAGRDSASVARVIAIAGIVRRVGDARRRWSRGGGSVECERVKRLRVPASETRPSLFGQWESRFGDSAPVSLGRAFGKIFLAFPTPPPANSFLPHTMLRSAPRVSAHTTHRRMAQAPGNGAGAKNGARHPPLAPSPSAEKRTHQPPVFLGGVSGEYDFPGASAGALYDGFHPGGTPIPATAASAYRSPTTTGDARTAEDATSRRAAQLKRCRGAGFIAALDQSGGSTPRALSLYGVNDIRADDKDAMFDAVHAMRTRIVTADAFDGAKIFGAILFQDTVFQRLVQGKKPTATYLWEDKGIVPFLKIDKGLQPEADGVQLMKPIPELDRTLLWCGGSGRDEGTKDPGSLKAVLDIADELVSFFLFAYGQLV